MHAYVFYFQFEEKGNIIGFFVSSDYDRNKALYFVLLYAWISYMDFVISDDVVSLRATFNEEKSDYIYTLKKRGDRRV